MRKQQIGDVKQNYLPFNSNSPQEMPYTSLVREEEMQ